MSESTEFITAAESIQAFTFLVTDEDLSVLLADDPSGLALVYPNEDTRLAPPVASAIRRTLVARRALLSSADGDHLEPIEPWSTLIVMLAGNAPAARVTTSDDATRATVVVVGPEDTLTFERDPTGVNHATFTGPGFGAATVVAPLLEARGEEPPPELPAGGATYRLTPDAFDTGRLAIGDGDDERARALLGEAFDLLFAAGTTHLVELFDRSAPDRLSGLEFEVLDAADLGWVLCVPCDDDPALVELRQVDDAGLTAFVGSVLPD